MMAVARRLTVFLLALVVALGIPVRATVAEREPLLRDQSGSFSAQPLPESTVLVSAVYSAPGASSHSRQAHDPFATPAWLPGTPVLRLLDTPPVPETGRVCSPPFRIYPLLI